MDLDNYLERFISSKQSLNRSQQTIDAYRYHVAAFAKWCAGKGYSDNDLTGKIGAETIEQHLLDLRNQGLSSHTAHSRYRHLRTFYNFVHTRFGPFEAGNPFTWLTEPATLDTLPKAISYADFTLLVHSIQGDHWSNQRDRAIIKTLFYTGMRANELLSLTIGDLDLERRRIRLMRWKTKREDFIPLSRSLGDDLRTWVSETRPACTHDGLWPSLERDHSSGAPIVYDGLKELLRRRCKQAGIKTYRAHAFRHGCAAHIIQRGGDISLIKDLLGHSELTTTQIYLRFDVGRLTGLYDRIFD